MIRGKTNSNLEVTVVVGFQDPQGGFQSFECVLDTGYDGEMALPTEAIQRLGLTPLGNRIITQADGQPVRMPAYKGVVSWHGQPVEVVVIQTDEEAIIGTQLLEHSTVTIQVWDGGNVLIDERPLSR